MPNDQEPISISPDSDVWDELLTADAATPDAEPQPSPEDILFAHFRAELSEFGGHLEVHLDQREDFMRWTNRRKFTGDFDAYNVKEDLHRNVRALIGRHGQIAIEQYARIAKLLDWVLLAEAFNQDAWRKVIIRDLDGYLEEIGIYTGAKLRWYPNLGEELDCQVEAILAPPVVTP